MFGSEISYTRWDHSLSLTVWGIISPLFLSLHFSGADPGGGGGSGGQDPPPPFGGPPNSIKREKTSCACARVQPILVVNSYPDPTLRNPVTAPEFCHHPNEI